MFVVKYSTQRRVVIFDGGSRLQKKWLLVRRMGEGENGWFATLTISIFLRDCYLEHTRFLSLSDKKLVIVSTAIPPQPSWKQRDQSSGGLHKTCSLIGPLLHVMKNALGR